MKIEILKHVQYGTSNYSFTVKQEYNRFRGTWHTVYAKFFKDMSGTGFPDFGCTFKVVCLTSPTEAAAINYAGKKLIKNWININ